MSYEAPLPVHERFTAPNGAPIDIYRENGTDFVKLVDITRALGYAKGSTAVRGINFALKSAQIPIFEKKLRCNKNANSVFVIPVQQVCSFLTAFRKLPAVIRPANNRYSTDLYGNACMEAQKLIRKFTDRFKQQDIYDHEEPFMKNNYDLREKIGITTPNGTTMRVFTDGVNEFVKTTTIARALGYSAFVVDNSLLALVFKNTGFHLYTKPMQGGKPTYFNNTKQVVPILQAFIRLALMTRQTNPAYLAKIDDARMEAERLIPVFKREVLGEPCTSGTYTKAVFVPGENQNPVQEVKQMQNDTTIQITVPPVTVMDIEDIGERADAVVKVFGVSKINALRAVTQLKAQEINRDLQPILDLLAVN